MSPRCGVPGNAAAALLLCCSAAAAAQDTSGSDIRVERDLRYARGIEADVRERRLDVYAPAGASAAGVVVSLHGGSGTKDDAAYVELSSRLAAEGMVVFNATYRGASPRAYAADDGVLLREAWESAICAVRFARSRARSFGGDPSRVTVVGHSAGGFFGLLASLLGGDSSAVWRDFASSRGAPTMRMECEAPDTEASVEGFVGFNGAYFVLAFFGVPSEDAELWRLVNPASYSGRRPSLVTRFILGANDSTQPDRHLAMVRGFSLARSRMGSDSDVVLVEAEHGYAFSPNAWRTTLATIRAVARGS